MRSRFFASSSKISSPGSHEMSSHGTGKNLVVSTGWTSYQVSRDAPYEDVKLRGAIFALRYRRPTALQMLAGS